MFVCLPGWRALSFLSITFSSSLWYFFFLLCLLTLAYLRLKAWVLSREEGCLLHFRMSNERNSISRPCVFCPKPLTYRNPIWFETPTFHVHRLYSYFFSFVEKERKVHFLLYSRLDYLLLYYYRSVYLASLAGFCKALFSFIFYGLDCRWMECFDEYPVSSTKHMYYGQPFWCWCYFDFWHVMRWLRPILKLLLYTFHIWFVSTGYSLEYWSFN